MVVLVVQHRQDFVGHLVDLVAIRAKLADHVLAARMHHDIERLKERDPVLNRALPLDGGHDLRKTVASHVADDLWSRAISGDPVIPGLRHLVEQRRRLVHFAADRISLMVDVERAALQITAHQDGWIDREPPVRPEAKHGVGWRVELLDLPVAEHARL